MNNVARSTKAKRTQKVFPLHPSVHSDDAKKKTRCKQNYTAGTLEGSPYTKERDTGIVRSRGC